MVADRPLLAVFGLSRPLRLELRMGREPFSWDESLLQVETSWAFPPLRKLWESQSLLHVKDELRRRLSSMQNGLHIWCCLVGVCF